MFTEQLSFRFLIVTLAILFACSNTADGDYYDDFDKKVDDIFDAMLDAKKYYKCLVYNWNPFQQCYDTMKNSWLAYKDEGHSDPDFCCQILEYRKCVKMTSNGYCFKIENEVAYEFLGPIWDDVSQCDGFLKNFICSF